MFLILRNLLFHCCNRRTLAYTSSPLIYIPATTVHKIRVNLLPIQIFDSSLTMFLLIIP
jgi:hypothetical protein